MTLSIRFVESAYVNQTWPYAEKFIAEAMEKGGGGAFPDWADNYNTHHIQAFVASGAWLLIVAIDEDGVIHGACTVSFVNYPLHRIAFITATGGKLVVSSETLSELKQILKRHGATKIQAYCRKSVVRLLERLDFEPRNTLVEVLL